MTVQASDVPTKTAPLPQQRERPILLWSRAAESVVNAPNDDVINERILCWFSEGWELTAETFYFLAQHLIPDGAADMASLPIANTIAGTDKTRWGRIFLSARLGTRLRETARVMHVQAGWEIPTPKDKDD